MNVYLLEDNKDLSFLISSFFKKEKIEIKSFTSGAKLYQHLIKHNGIIDTFILDIMVSGLNGDELIEYIREKFPKSFIVMTSALTDEKTILKCFKMGANDYLRKPFHLTELLYKIRKHHEQQDTKTLTLNGWIVDQETRRCTKKNQKVKLEHKEMDFLNYLSKHTERWTSKEKLLKHIWNIEDVKNIETKRVEVCVGRIRKKLGKEAVITSRKEGYKIGE